VGVYVRGWVGVFYACVSFVFFVLVSSQLEVVSNDGIIYVLYDYSFFSLFLWLLSCVVLLFSYRREIAIVVRMIGTRLSSSVVILILLCR